ncbi:MAG: hypothetical protein JWR85_2655 [Marmoricola sp.]|nr:hypothetical protein [Marmoricola sp.]
MGTRHCNDFYTRRPYQRPDEFPDGSPSRPHSDPVIPDPDQNPGAPHQEAGSPEEPQTFPADDPDSKAQPGQMPDSTTPFGSDRWPIHHSGAGPEQP